MRILVLGAGGQVGREVCRAAWPPWCEVSPLDRSAIDITKAAAVVQKANSKRLGQSIALGPLISPLRAAHHIILRTAWVYGVLSTNFVKTMLRLGAERPLLCVVADQHGCPTGAADITAALMVIAVAIERGSTNCGTFHFAGVGSVSWHGFAEEIFDIAVTLVHGHLGRGRGSSRSLPSNARRRRDAR